MKKSIVQQHEFGCGIACVAFTTNKTYQNIIEFISEQSSKASTKGYSCKELVQLLSEFNYNYTYKYVKSRFRKKIYSIHH